MLAEERWGRRVFHCPFCHGWKVRDQPLGVLGSGATGVQRAVLLRGWSDDVTLLTDGPRWARRRGRRASECGGRRRATRRGAARPGRHAHLGRIRRRLRAAPRRTARHHAPAFDACRTTRRCHRPCQHHVDEAVDIDAMSYTSVPGLSTAGGLTLRMPSVASAIAAGHKAAAMIVHGLLFDTSEVTPAGVGQNAR